MAKQAQQEAFVMPKTEPGVLIGVEVSYRPVIDMSADEEAALGSLATTIEQRDMPARREEVIQIWEKRLFDRGQQHILPRRGGGWQIPAVGTGYGPGEAQQRSIFETNIINSYGQIIISALTREVPGVRFDPIDPDDDADITTSEHADQLRERINRTNRMKSRMAEMARFLWTDGRALFVTGYVKDGQAFGYENPALEEEEDETVPETEEAESEAEADTELAEDENADESNAMEEQEDSAERDGGEEGGGETDGEAESGDSSADDEETEGVPRGQEVICVVGGLESKLAIKAENLSETLYVKTAKEIDLQAARAKYPKVAEKITAGQGGPGGDDIDRLARVNVRLGVFDQFVTTDSQAYDVTETKLWLRPAQLLEIPKQEVRESLIKKAGRRGLRVVFCGKTLCEVRSIAIEDQITLVHAAPGDGMHRPGLCDWLMPIQKVLNNWSELADDYFVRGVPNKWMDAEMFNVEALRKQVNMPGAVHPFTREDGVTMEQVIWQETPAQFPEQLQSFILLFQNELPQLLCGAFPALSGGGDSSSTDTLGGMLVQRDQALGRIGLPWREIKEAIANVFRQAVICLAHNSDGPIKMRDGEESVTIQLEDLKGNFTASPEVDEGFPESHTAIQNRLTQLWTDAATNPQLGEFLYNPDNLEVFLRTFQVKGFYLPQVAARDKQLGEAAELLHQGPAPNPQVEQAEEQIAVMEQQLTALQEKAKQVAQSGQTIDPGEVQQAQALQTQIAAAQKAVAALPPMVSSVPIDADVDDNATEMATCWKILNSVRGRKMKNGTPDEQAGIANLRLHYLEHKAANAKNQANAPKAKVSFSANAKDLPPKEAAAVVSAGGIPAQQSDFEQQQVADAAEKHPGPGGVQVAQ